MCFDRDLHLALSRKAEATEGSIPGVVDPLAEDAEDRSVFQSRSHELNIDFDNVVRSLRQRGKL